MRKYCMRLETGDKKSERAKYQESFYEIKEWYLKQHKNYEIKLKNDLIASLSEEFLKEIDAWQDLKMTGYTDNLAAKTNLFNMADIMCRHMLSVYTYGPDKTMPVRNWTPTQLKESWLKCKLNAFDINELLQLQLQINHEGAQINLSVLTEERGVRNSMTHAGQISNCVSAIRCYNILREMIIFMDPESRPELPCFTYPDSAICDMQNVMGILGDFQFEKEHTLLIVGSLCDIPTEGRELLANLPWTLVLDFDGCSDFGGLRSAVKHSVVHDQKLGLDTMKNFIPRKGYTTWFTVGDFCEFTYCNNPKETNKIIFDAKSSFCTFYHAIKQELRKVFELLLKKLSTQLRSLNVLYLLPCNCNNITLAKYFIEECEQYYLTDLKFSFTALYYEPHEVWQDIYDGFARSYADVGADGEVPFHTYFCDLDSFFDGLLAYRTALPAQSQKTGENILPSNQGCREISRNLALDLDTYFDVLYDNIGSESQESEKEKISAFYSGGTAPWCVFLNDSAIPLMRPLDYEKNLNVVRSALGRKPDVASEKIFNLIHRPGIGGSTLMRKIGWDIHKDYPVLLVRKYNPNIKGLIQRLYDDRLKGILLLADESIDDVDRLKHDVCTLDRACVLVLSGREGHLVAGPKEKKIPFTTIVKKSEDKLCMLFKMHSPLSQKQLIQKDKEYDRFIKQSSSMRCPFMIGLYYQEESFNGVESYVGQLMKRISDKKELEAIAMIALCDVYAQEGLPKQLIKTYLNISGRNDYMSISYVNAIFLASENSDDIEIYRSKHYVISSKLLEYCSNKLYNSSLESSLKTFSELIINVIFAAYQNKPNATYQKILERLFINQDIGQGKFAHLILDIPLPTSRKSVLEYLAEQFNGLVERYSPEEHEELYRMTSHFYGHLGRLCSDSEKGVDNPQDAKKYCEKAVSLMEQAASESHPDPRIYHMLGEATRRVLQKEWDTLETVPTVGDYDRFEREISVIRDIYDQAAWYGSEDYAIVSKIDMYIRYLKKVYYWNKISKVSQLNLLSTSQAAYRVEIEELIEQLSSLPMDERTNQLYLQNENAYRADVMLGDYDKTIMYYENKLVDLKKTPGKDLEIQEILKSLVNIRLGRYRNTVNEQDGRYVVMEAKELTTILEHLEELLGQTIDAQNYRQRSQRVASYDRWFRLAKMLGSRRTVQNALNYAQRWKDLDAQAHSNDPRPYYYLYILSALSVLDGNHSDIALMRQYRQTCAMRAEKFGYNMDNIQDFLIEGTGMNRLLDARYAGKKRVEYLESAPITPMVLGGSFDVAESGKGFIKLYTPPQWAGEIVKFSLGTKGSANTVGENQLTHKIMTFAGFSYEELRAVDHYVRDQTTNEPKPVLKQRGNNNRNKPAVVPHSLISQEYTKSSINTRGTFIARKITASKGLRGVFQTQGIEYQATLPKNCVTTAMLSSFKQGKLFQIEACICDVASQGDRYILCISK